MRKISEGLWTLESEVRMPGGVRFPARMTVIEPSPGELLLHSPLPLSDTDAAAIAELGDVRWIVAPNGFHNGWFGEAAQRYPEATLIGAEASVAKLKAVDFDATLGDAIPDWPDAIRPVAIAGAPRVDEWVFFLPESRTLVCTDLVFSIHRPPNFLTGLVLRLVGAHGGFAVSRSWKWLFRKDRDAFSASVREVLALDIERIVMAHGDVLDHGGRAALAEAFTWAVRAERPLLEGT